MQLNIIVKKAKTEEKSPVTDLPELHDKVHEVVGGGGRGLGGGRRLGPEEVLDGDLVLDGLVEEALTGAQLAVHQDLNLSGEIGNEIQCNFCIKSISCATVYAIISRTDTFAIVDQVGKFMMA